MMNSMISRAGDLHKNNERVKLALEHIHYPETYDEKL